MSKNFKIFLLAAALSACGDTTSGPSDETRFLEVCGEAISRRLKSQSSYTVINYKYSSEPYADADDLDELRSMLKYRQVRADSGIDGINVDLENYEASILEDVIITVESGREAMRFEADIEYDAKNGLGLPIRYNSVCRYDSIVDSLDKSLSYHSVKIDGQTNTDWLIERIKRN